MPYGIKLENLPAGYALESAKKDEMVKVSVREFVSSEDGDLFIERLEGAPSELIARLPSTANISPSTIDHFLAIIGKDHRAKVYVNELPLIIKTRIKGEKQKGDPILLNEVVDIESLSLGEIDIPIDSGIVFLFSVGWRKGLFFDFSTFHQENYIRDYDLGRLLGNYYTYLTSQHLFKIREEEWDQLFREQWFPFSTLNRQTVIDVISQVRNGWEVDELIERIGEEVAASADAMLNRWKTSSILIPHIELLTHAVERYLENDYISVTAILYPRIEGIMRSVHLGKENGKKATQKNLVSSVVEARQADRHESSLLLPQMFRRYLEQVYFANFRPNEAAEVARHSVSHGVADQKKFSIKSATIGLLVLDQLFFYLPEKPTINASAQPRSQATRLAPVGKRCEKLKNWIRQLLAKWKDARSRG